MRTFGLYIHGHFVHPGPLRPVVPPADPTAGFARVGWLEAGKPESEEILEIALQGAAETFEQVLEGSFFPLGERLAFLDKLRARLLDNLDFLATLLSKEVGKPLRLARTEVRRAVATLEWTVREAPAVFAPHGLPTASVPEFAGIEGAWQREPRGPLLAITPFNFPANLVMHKLAPALAAGCPVLLKPSPKAAATAMAIADMCHAAGLPAGMLAVLNCDDALVAKALTDPRVRQVSFTGSAKVGW
jgi:acyl-CoA reductase-like NAD-dependent aldehyde dehydrogenase